MPVAPFGRFIPTAVGNAAAGWLDRKKFTVHPHGCGERTHAAVGGVSPAGSSPRLWGTHKPRIRGNTQERFIPTAVGNAKTRPARRPASSGSSPRLWGTRFPLRPGNGPSRFIPTAVGNAITIFPFAIFHAVHPHGCGERLPPSNLSLLAPGSSPRLWGTLEPIEDTAHSRRFIPTAVGNALPDSAIWISASVHPHGCGERGISQRLVIP